jgi:hypothetical protein
LATLPAPITALAFHDKIYLFVRIISFYLFILRRATMQPYPQNTQPPDGQNTLLPGEQQQPLPRLYKYYFDEKQMHRYFYPPAKIWMWLFGIGVVFFLFGIIMLHSVSGGFIVGLFPLAIGSIALLIHYTQRPSSEQYEKWVAERCEALYDKAKQRLHLDEKDDCEHIIEVQGGISSLLQLTKKFPEKEIIVKRLPSGFRHYSINNIIYIFRTKSGIAIYSGYINALAQHERFEDADHYYYKDIIAVSTTGPTFVFEEGLSEREEQRQGFLIRANEGDTVGTDYAVKVVLRDGKNREQLNGVDEVVAALLHLLRDYKTAS